MTKVHVKFGKGLCKKVADVENVEMSLSKIVNKEICPELDEKKIQQLRETEQEEPQQLKKRIVIKLNYCKGKMLSLTNRIKNGSRKEFSNHTKK